MWLLYFEFDCYRYPRNEKEFQQLQENWIPIDSLLVVQNVRDVHCMKFLALNVLSDLNDLYEEEEIWCWDFV